MEHAYKISINLMKIFLGIIHVVRGIDHGAAILE